MTDVASQDDEARHGRMRKDDTRRKILAGAILLAKVESGDFDARTFRRWLDKALTRKDDRELFRLPPT
jgi:hypothetical protein